MHFTRNDSLLAKTKIGCSWMSEASSSHSSPSSTLPVAQRDASAGSPNQISIRPLQLPFQPFFFLQRNTHTDARRVPFWPIKPSGGVRLNSSLLPVSASEAFIGQGVRRSNEFVFIANVLPVEMADPQ